MSTSASAYGCAWPRALHEWQPGAKVDVRVDASRAFVFDAGGKLADAGDDRENGLRADP